MTRSIVFGPGASICVLPNVGRDLPATVDGTAWWSITAAIVACGGTGAFRQVNRIKVCRTGGVVVNVERDGRFIGSNQPSLVLVCFDHQRPSHHTSNRACIDGSFTTVGV